MKKLFCISLMLFMAVTAGGPTSGQALVDTDDPRQLALDIFAAVSRGSEPATIAVRLQSLIRIFRFRCTRLTDYQVFSRRTNVIDFKAKCSGDPLYGVTVATNGYVSVYGGNGIVSSFNRNDGLILIFDNEGELSGDRSLTVEQAVGETVDRLELEEDINIVYVMGTIATMLGFVMVIGLIWWQAWRFRQTRKPRQRMKPMARHRVNATSADKDAFIEESKSIGKHIWQHPQGFYIAQGKRGKRRLFSGYFGAKLYASRGWRLFEISAPSTRATDIDSDASPV